MGDTQLYNLIFGNLSLEDSLRQFLLTKKTEGISPKTEKFYDLEFGYFIKYARERNVTHVFEVSQNLIREFLVKMGETRNKGGVHASFRAVRAIFNWYESEIEPENWKNPIHKIKIPTPRPVAIQGLTMEDFTTLVNICKGSTGQRDKAMFYGLLDSCARAMEFINLNVGDCNLITGDVLIKAGKGDEPRYVQFGSKTRKELRRYLKSRENLNNKSPLFTNKKDERFSYNSLVSLIRWRCGQAKIETPG